MGFKYVSDIVREDYKSWDHSKPIVINAATGTGKTYFILEKLLPYVHSNGKRILYLSNRTALKQQVESKIKSEYENSIKVCNYQRFANTSFALHNNYESSDVKRAKEDSYILSADYYVLDEAHFFLEDSSFNVSINDCIDKINTLRNRNKESIWIFITATAPYLFIFLANCLFIQINYSSWHPELNKNYPYSVRLLLKYKECDYKEMIEFEDYIRRDVFFEYDSFSDFWEFHRQPSKNHFSSELNSYHRFFTEAKTKCKYYSLDADYSYITPVYYTHDIDIIDAICNTPSDEKWLIFVESEAKGYKLKKELISCGYEDTAFVTAKNKTVSGSPEKGAFRSIIKYEKFPQRILIATKVLDNGVNFKDPDLKHIVVQSFEETSFLQMVGRKRRENEEDRIRLYIKDIPEGKIRKLFETRILQIIQFWHALSNLQSPDCYDDEFYHDLGIFKNKYTKSGHYLNPFNIYVRQKSRNNNVKYSQFFLIQEFDPVPFFKDKITYDYYKMLAMFEQAQNERFDRLKEQRFKTEEEYFEAERSITDQHMWLKEQLSWLGFEYDPNNWVSYKNVALTKSQQELENFLNEHEGILKIEEEKTLKELFKAFIKNIRPVHKHSKSKGSISVINKCFEEFDFPYRIKSIKKTRYGKQRNWWHVVFSPPSIN